MLLLKFMFNLVDSHSGHDLPGYYPHEDDRGSLRGMRDTDSINASYDRYLRSAVFTIWISLTFLTLYISCLVGS